MLYYYFKIFHVITAALLLTSMGYSYSLWRRMRINGRNIAVAEQIQIQTWSIIVPLAIIQLATGFTMISVQHYNLSQLWVTGSVIGFIIVIGSWFSFIYFLLLSQQALDHTESKPRLKIYRKAQSVMLSVCAAATLSMIFLMANKTSL